MFKSICRFYKYVLYFISLYSFIKYKDTIHSTKYLNRLEKHIYNCGPIGIKLIQSLIMYDNIIPESLSNKLQYTLENCRLHSWEYTKNIYYKKFKRHIYDDFEISTSDVSDTNNTNYIVGSGSIGQVYKLYSKYLQKYVAVKVKHPDITQEIQYFASTISRVLSICSKFVTIPYKNVIDNFVNNIQKQNDFMSEVTNTQKLRENFKNDTHIIIPEVYDYNEDIIIMSYHEGVEVTQVNKKLLPSVSNDINFILLSSILVHDFIHADLHNGNWKIQLLDNNKYNIVIYDCGLTVSTHNVEFNKEIMFAFMDGNYNNLYDIFDKRYVPSAHEKPCVKVQKMSNFREHINIVLNNPALLPSQRCINTLKYAINNNILVNSNYINLILSIIIPSRIHIYGLDRHAKIVNTNSYNGSKSIIVYYTYVFLLDKMNTYSSLRELLHTYLSKDASNIDFLKKWLYHTFGHDDIGVYKDIITKYNNA